MTEQDNRVRLDKWLWAARFFKTRALAKTAIEGGKVHYNGQRCKPGKIVELESQLKIRQGWYDKEVIVRGLESKRQSAPLAQALYEETEASIKDREIQVWQRKQLNMANMPPARRPTKKQRRQIHRFREDHDSNQ